MPKLLSELSFASLWSYCPRGDSQECRNSRAIVLRLKQDKFLGRPPLQASTLVAQRLKMEIEKEGALRSFWDSQVVLVPVPSHALALKGGLWVPDRIAKAIVSAGLAHSVSPCLTRKSAVPKSSYVSAKGRPTALVHYNSMLVKPPLSKPTRIMLVDDVITRGSTLLAAASLLRNAFPDSIIRAFAVVRTISNPEEFLAFLNPCTGKITLKGGETYRKP